MATITATNANSAAGAVTLTRTTLGSSDTFAFNTSYNPVLILDNVTAGALTVIIDGDGGTTVPVKGVGSVSVTGGYSTGSIAAGACVVIQLNTIFEYLRGTIAVTGGTGIKATLIEYR